MRRPALLTGDGTTRPPIQVARPAAVPLERVMARVRPSYDQGVLTDGPLVRELEEATAQRLGVAHAVAVSSGTVGLMLAIRALELSGPVVLPSFTFSATGHAVAWNGLALKLVECDPRSFQVDPLDLERHIHGASAVVAVHAFGAPCDVTRVQVVAERARVPVVYDAAAAFGASVDGRPIGSFGDAEVFSLTPTKPLVAAEGGLVTTNDAGLAAAVRTGRNYGNRDSYESEFVGLNGRMSELHAALALESLADLDENQSRRDAIAAAYQRDLAEVPGLSFQSTSTGDRPTWKDCSLAVDEGAFGLSRDDLTTSLRAEGIDTRTYFSPPLHRQREYSTGRAPLPVTDRVADSALSIPMFSELSKSSVEIVVEAIISAHEHAEELHSALGRCDPVPTEVAQDRGRLKGWGAIRS